MVAWHLVAKSSLWDLMDGGLQLTKELIDAGMDSVEVQYLG